MKPGDAVIVDDPCILNGNYGVVIEDLGNGRAYTAVMMAYRTTPQRVCVYIVRADVGVRPWTKGDQSFITVEGTA